MDKIAAYERVLSSHPLWESCDGILDPEFRKEALLKEVGQSVTGGVYRLGRALSGKPGTVGGSGSRTGVGGSMMDWASGLGGKADSGATLARRNAHADLSDANFSEVRDVAQKIVGGTTLAAGGAGLAGGGYLLGRPSGN